MLYLRTGLPGAGKTLNAIREIDIEHQPDPDDPTKRLHKDPDNPDLPPRTIYYYGIPDMKLDRLKSKWVEFDTPEEWYNLPDGSVIVIDEAQRVFGNDGSRARPEKVTRFETHRHQGLDIHLITQHPSLLCTPVRKLVGKHINFIRPYGREKGIFRHEYEFCIDNPERRSNFKQAQEERVTLDKAYFGVYKSSTVHTHKPITPSYMKKIPLIIALMLIPIGVLVGLVVTAMQQGDEEKEAALARSHAAEASAGVLPGAGNAVQAAPRASSGPKSADEFIGDMSPRVPDLVASAPRYDDLNKPRDFPRPVCAASSDPNLIGKAPERRIPMGTYNG
ncbi:TPA: zonular occludens toxin domain-containing protein, partial [Pseudomonas aeruginosa]